ncbi:hypothetical protein BOO29_02550 [Vibrio navarrensis]|uniref:Uncharacterized protein n=1 Tax=Vibrio navarrensis TaxID=29495 RepID=A0A099MDU1_9VIBR|nr:hypothetical protein EA26_10545 [Vibrio navarrensis]KGK18004.1 hypothetical protein EA25_10200 [Vibrio navarrensis]MBE3664534.1 hypothetical protein [Vibrio navarrensis]MBE4573187.1 hypothetical protein [Vibrio navarrensis]MBE4576976.1 hypothetical protein [Vibrio navarrensis]
MAKLVMTHQIVNVFVRLYKVITDRLMFVSTLTRRRRNVNKLNEKLREKFSTWHKNAGKCYSRLRI